MPELFKKVDRGVETSDGDAAGHTQDEISAAWNFARSTGYTDSTGLGADRLTAAGRARAAALNEPL